MSSRCNPCYIFLGPSAFGLDMTDHLNNASLSFLPPVKRGDITRLIDMYPPSSIAIVDGQFQQHLAVAHAEIRDALSKGWSIWGLSSMGAIRAYEMRNMGVRGYGNVYNEFFLHDDFKDDEVALLHSPMPPYFPISEPLVHIRTALNFFYESDLLGIDQKNSIINKLSGQWFGTRTLKNLKKLLAEEIKSTQLDIITQRLESFAQFRVKSHDVASYLKEKPWLNQQ